jgi:hypothetical protein
MSDIDTAAIRAKHAMDDNLARAQAAEARITAALGLCHQDPNCEPIWQLDDIRRALTGDTE